MDKEPTGAVDAAGSRSCRTQTTRALRGGEFVRIYSVSPDPSDILLVWHWRRATSACLAFVRSRDRAAT